MADSPPPLPSPPLRPEPEPPPAWQLSWMTVAYLALAMLLEAIGFRAILMLIHAGASPAWFSGRTLGGLGRTFWASALIGLGVVLAHRHGPASWPRPARWAVGAGLGALVGGLGTMSIRFHYCGSGPSPRSTLLLMLLSRGITALTTAFVGFYLARVLRADTKPWRRLPLAGMEAHLIVTGALEVVSTLPVMVLAGASVFLSAQRLQALGFSLAQAALIGLVVGCAFAAGLRRTPGDTI